ncbi:MipA/OmpV family protein [Thalassotalea euphylliae]|uniref:MipA/OmpV family protein n=1 Tax=Thalassotalea euphylliae TaxID=1655234 RepID=UPI0015F24CD5|nr:MipA/OmpV family protein [Thalassotalea euphylliae]
MTFVLLLATSIFSSVDADEYSCENPQANTNKPNTNKQSCITTGEWHIGVAVGLGVITNPLNDGDNIPLVLLPDIAWYGEKAYFDNGELGYQWHQETKHSFEGFVSVNRERAYFSFWHPSNILNPIENHSFIDATLQSDDASGRTEVSIDQVRSRDWALDAGLRWQTALARGSASITVKTDVTGVHHGQQLNLSYRLGFQYGEWQLGLSPSITWKSSALLDYYYGIDESDNLVLENFYQAKAGWQPQLDLSGIYPLADDWQLLFKLGYQWLNKGMYDSPLVKEKQVRTIFIGAAYQF